MRKPTLFENVLPKEQFQDVRKQEKDRFSLRSRMTLMVSAELLFSALVAALLAWILDRYIQDDSHILLPIVMVVTCVTVGTLVTSIVSKLFFDPIKKLGNAMEQIAEGDFSVRLADTASSKEILEVYTGFNMMAHELGATEMLQSDFVSNVSHEFKTPINAIEGYSMLLQGSDNLSPDQEEYVEKIIFNTQRLSSLVGSILLLSKLENQQIQTNRTPFRLDEQIRQSIVAKEAEWDKKDIDFDVELETIEYVGNEPMMRHVWDNLIGNAIKFSPRGGLIRMALTKADHGIEFIIEDQGPGFSEEALKHLYDKFYQADSSHKEQGNGLGLALVKRILILEKGRIQAENIPSGSRFTVTLQNT